MIQVCNGAHKTFNERACPLNVAGKRHTSVQETNHSRQDRACGCRRIAGVALTRGGCWYYFKQLRFTKHLFWNRHRNYRQIEHPCTFFWPVIGHPFPWIDATIQICKPALKVVSQTRSIGWQENEFPYISIPFWLPSSRYSSSRYAFNMFKFIKICCCYDFESDMAEFEKFYAILSPARLLWSRMTFPSEASAAPSGGGAASPVMGGLRSVERDRICGGGAFCGDPRGMGVPSPAAV